MTAGVPALRLVRSPSTEAAETGCAASYQQRPVLGVNWLAMLRDLTTCGVLRFQLSNRLLNATFRAEPWSVKALADDVVEISGLGILARVDLSYWAQACLQRVGDADYRSLLVKDHTEQLVLKVSLCGDSNWPKFSPALVRAWSGTMTPKAVPLPVLQGQAQEGPARNRCVDIDVDAGTAADASLLGPFFEALVEQAIPLRVSLFNPGQSQTFTVCFKHCLQCGERLQLRSAALQLCIGMRQAIGLRVVVPEKTRTHAELYFIDVQGKCAAQFAIDQSAQMSEQRLWSCLTRALIF